MTSLSPESLEMVLRILRSSNRGDMEHILLMCYGLDIGGLEIKLVQEIAKALIKGKNHIKINRSHLHDLKETMGRLYNLLCVDRVYIDVLTTYLQDKDGFEEFVDSNTETVWIRF